MKQAWDTEVDRLFHLNTQPKPAQSEVIGALWEASGPRDVLVSAAGSHPGDLHKLWRTRTPNGYHLEYGYSTMGYEIPGALGTKLADPSREVYVFLGDGTYLMMPTEIVTAVQEHIKVIIVLVDNKGFASIGGLSRSLGLGGFGTSYRQRSAASGQLDGDALPVDFAANARSLGADAIEAGSLTEFKAALEEAKKRTGSRSWSSKRSREWVCPVTTPGGMWPWARSHRSTRSGRRERATSRPASRNVIICVPGRRDE